MAASRKDISKWFDRGVSEKHDYLIVVCDTYDWEDYHVYASKQDVHTKYDEYNGKNMQRVMEVYDLLKPKAPQMNQSRCLELPRKAVQS